MTSLREQAELLRQDSTPTTFLDAMRLVRRATALDADELQALVELHDAPNTTDGAREVLADFLRGRALTMAHERANADRTLTLLDSGKMLRGRQGQVIKIQLDTRSHRGGIWEVKDKSKHVDFTYQGLDAARRYTMAEIILKKPGKAHIELVEHLAPPKKSHARSQKPTDEDRIFRLDIAIESEKP
jgi:hypothetical protein